MADDPYELLGRAVAGGRRAELDAWASTGPAGLAVLRDVLTGKRAATAMGDTHPRDAIDNESAAIAAIAAAHPTAFLEVFDNERFDSNALVLLGLGEVDDPRATERLIGASGSEDRWVRMQVAISLGRRDSPPAREALGRLVDDQDYLVRYHAAASLGRLERSAGPGTSG